MEPLNALQVLPRLAECAALIAVGYNLKTAGLFSADDGATALRLASYTTLPSLILYSLSGRPPLMPYHWAGVVCSCMLVGILYWEWQLLRFFVCH